MTPEPRPLAHFTTPMLNDWPCDHAVTVDIADCRLIVHSNDQALVSDLGRYFAHCRSEQTTDTISIHAIQTEPPDIDAAFCDQPREPGKTRRKEEFVDLPDGRIVRKVRTGMLFFFGHDQHVAIGDCVANPNQIVNFIINRYIDWRLARRGILLHAAAVSRGHNGLALTGISGAGKSTLGLHLMERGFDFVSNDRLIVERDDDALTMYGVPKQPRVNPGTILASPTLENLLTPTRRDELRRMATNDLWDLEEKYDAHIGELYGPNRQRLSARMAGLVILNWQRNDEPTRINEITLRDRPDLLAAVRKSPGAFGFATFAQRGDINIDEDYFNFFDNCPTYEITGGLSFDIAAAHADDLLSNANVTRS